MADYLIQGMKGNGKSLVVVSRIRDALRAGIPVATNLDLFLDAMDGLPHGMRNVRCYRLPDRPTVDDLRAIGRGSDGMDESKFGIVALDEGASFLNARTYNDKGRQDMLDWFVHSRKLGWNSYFLCQNQVQIDKQVRESLVEFIVTCKRLDKVRIPFLGALTKNLLGVEVRPPKMHVATVKYGKGNDAMMSDRWMYTGTRLYTAYDTNQVFKADYQHGLFCYLPPWHLTRTRVPIPKRGILAFLHALFVPARPTVIPKPALRLVDTLKGLPPDQRIAHWRRLNRLGAI